MGGGGAFIARGCVLVLVVVLESAPTRGPSFVRTYRAGPSSAGSVDLVRGEVPPGRFWILVDAHRFALTRVGVLVDWSMR